MTDARCLICFLRPPLQLKEFAFWQPNPLLKLLFEMDSEK